MSKMSPKNKTQPTSQRVVGFFKTLSKGEQQQAKILLKVFKEATTMKPVMWGDMIGFGSYHYTYASGREGDMSATGFSIRKSGPTIYIMPGYQDYGSILKYLCPHRLGMSCLYIKNLANIDTTVLQNSSKPASSVWL